MACRFLATLCTALCLLLPPANTRAADNQAQPAGAESFEKSVRPVLSANCFMCHGPEKQKGNLRLDSRTGMLSGGDSGPAIVPGHPEESLLVKAVHYGDEPRMPPKGKLSADAIAALTTSIRQGAIWPEHET